MSSLISICTITVICTWIWAHPLAYFYLSAGSTLTPQSKRPLDQPDTMALRHKAVQFLANGLATTTRATYAAGQQRFAANSLPTALPPPPEPPTQLGNKGSQPFVKPLMLPQSSYRTHPSVIHNTPGNFQHCSHHYQGLHLRHPVHACVSRTTRTI